MRGRERKREGGERGEREIVGRGGGAGRGEREWRWLGGGCRVGRGGWRWEQMGMGGAGCPARERGRIEFVSFFIFKLKIKKI